MWCAVLCAVDYPLRCLAPPCPPCPLQLALESEDVDTVRLLLSHFDLLNGDSDDDALISGIISKVISGEPNVDTDRRTFDQTAFGAAIKLGSAKIIRSYFSSGEPYTSRDLYLATEAAVQSKDYSIWKLLVEYRPTGKIDT